MYDPEVKPSIPIGLVQALTRRRSQQPAPASNDRPGDKSPLGSPGEQTVEQQQAAPPPQKKKRGHVLKEQRDELIKGILGNILKQ